MKASDDIKQKMQEDSVFARICFARNSFEYLNQKGESELHQLSGVFKGSSCISDICNANNGKVKASTLYSSDENELLKIEEYKAVLDRYSNYRLLLVGKQEHPFSDYLNNIFVEDIRAMLEPLEDNDVARVIQGLYKQGDINNDLGRIQLRRYLFLLDLPPPVNYLNEARREDILPFKYDM